MWVLKSRALLLEEFETLAAEEKHIKLPLLELLPPFPQEQVNPGRLIY